MSRNLLDMLDYEAARQPVLADLIARIDLLGEAEIKTAPVKLPWMRKALLLLKQERAQTALGASLEPWIIDGHTPDPMGEMRRWEGADAFVRVGETSLEVRCGQLLWFDQTGVWLDTIHTTHTDPLIARNTVSCGQVRRSDYLLAVRGRTKQLCPELAAPHGLERVRFFRPG